MTGHAVLLLHPDDNVLVACRALVAGETIDAAGVPMTVVRSVGLGHKLARVALKAGDKVRRYGSPIGSMTRDAAPGEHVHLHNLQSDYLHTYTLDSGNAFVPGAPEAHPPDAQPTATPPTFPQEEHS